MNKKEMIILIGIQGSGKSTFYHKYLGNSHVHINLDTLHTRNKERIAMEECLQKHKSMVIDNTNPTRAEREKYIAAARENDYRVIGYYFKSGISECIERNELREGKAKVPRNAIAATSKKLELPEYGEGFDELYYVQIGQDNYIVESWRDDDEV